MLCVSTSPGQRIQELRAQSRISARAAGDIAKVSQSTITNIENKADYLDFSNPRHRDIVKRLARAFQVSPGYIWDGVHTDVVEAREERAPFDTGREQDPRTSSSSSPVPSSMLHFLLDLATDMEMSPAKRQQAKKNLAQFFDTLDKAQ